MEGVVGGSFLRELESKMIEFDKYPVKEQSILREIELLITNLTMGAVTKNSDTKKDVLQSAKVFLEKYHFTDAFREITNFLENENSIAKSYRIEKSVVYEMVDFLANKEFNEKLYGVAGVIDYLAIACVCGKEFLKDTTLENAMDILGELQFTTEYFLIEGYFKDK